MPAMRAADDAEDYAFGMMLRRFRDAAHLTQEALAERAGQRAHGGRGTPAGA